MSEATSLVNTNTNRWFSLPNGVRLIKAIRITSFTVRVLVNPALHLLKCLDFLCLKTIQQTLVIYLYANVNQASRAMPISQTTTTK
jgi:hypothetical protein